MVIVENVMVQGCPKELENDCQGDTGQKHISHDVGRLVKAEDDGWQKQVWRR